MNARVLSILFLGTIVAVGSAGSALAGVVFSDNFSSAGDAANYTYVNVFNGGSPTWTTGNADGGELNTPAFATNTAYEILNTGPTFAQGDTLTATFSTNFPQQSVHGFNFVGLGFVGLTGGNAEALTGDNGSPYVEGTIGGNTALPSGFDAVNGATISITRGTGVDGNVYYGSISGGGVSGTTTWTSIVGLASDTVSFGPGAYNGYESITSLVLTSAPEPSSVVALCGLGAMGLFLIARRRRKS